MLVGQNYGNMGDYLIPILHAPIRWSWNGFDSCKERHD